MRNSRFAILFVPVVMVTCGGGGGGDTTDEANQPDATPADPGSSSDDAAADPGTSDPGMLDTSPQDPGGKDTSPPKDPGSTPETIQPDVTEQCPSVVTGPTCAAKVACALQCADAAYGAACVGTGGDQATQQAESALTCLKALDCVAVIEDESFSDCAASACEVEIDACFTGTGICNDIRKCRMACEPSDPACPLRCRGEATLEQQDVWDTYWECIMNADCVAQGNVMPNGWPTENCERHAQSYFCPLQTQACIPPQ